MIPGWRKGPLGISPPDGDRPEVVRSAAWWRRLLLACGLLAIPLMLMGQEPPVPAPSAGGKTSAMEYIVRFMPMLLQGAVTTIWISIVSMLLASSLGLTLALTRLYGHPILAGLATTYIEFVRGTPLLIQLYFIYYGLPQLIPALKLSSEFAAVLGMGLNYAAYEAEIYRAGIMAVPRQQTEAALALGLTRKQAIRLIVLPQALRLVVPPVTNDFVALFKDTSIISIVAISELTKNFTKAAFATGRYMEFAIVTALMYFAISYPLSLLARRLERRIHPHHDQTEQPQ